MVSCFKVITFASAVKMLVKTLGFFVDNLKKYPTTFYPSNLDSLTPKMPEMMYHTCFCHNYEGRFSNLCVCDNSFQNGLQKP